MGGQRGAKQTAYGKAGVYCTLPQLVVGVPCSRGLTYSNNSKPNFTVWWGKIRAFPSVCRTSECCSHPGRH